MSVPDAAAFPPFIRVVGHPLRWRLMAELARTDLRVRELVGLVAEPQNVVSYHLRVLRSGGLVSAKRSSFDARDSYYHLDLDRCAEGLTRTGGALHPALGMIPRPSPTQITPRDVAKPSVLFVCTGNSARSPMAEAIMRHRVGDQVRVSSAGTEPKDRIHPHAVRVLREQYGIDITGQVPQPVDLGAGVGFDHVVTLCDKAREHLPAAGDWLPVHWSLPDPAVAAEHNGSGYRRFVMAAAEIDARVGQLLPTVHPATRKEDRL